MKVAVVGGGISGNAIRRAILDLGAEAELFSRRTGFDVLREDAVEHLAGFDVIVDAASRFTTRKKQAVDFFTRATRNLARAANTHAAKHILLSIVNCERQPVTRYGYFAGKAAQERVAQAESKQLVVVRSTQWFEFAQQNLERLRVGQFALVPQMLIRPVALDAVAEIIAEAAVGKRHGTRYDLAGPEVMTLWKMTAQLPNKPVHPITMVLPGAVGRAFRDGSALPGDEAEIIGPKFSTWLAKHPANGYDARPRDLGEAPAK